MRLVSLVATLIGLALAVGLAICFVLMDRQSFTTFQPEFVPGFFTRTYREVHVEFTPEP